MSDRPREPRYRVISQWLREQILSGALGPGHPLPSEERLAQRFGVSRPTVRQGIAELRHAGLVDVLVGRGSFVRTQPARPAVVRRRGDCPEGMAWTGVGDGPVLGRSQASVAVAELLRVPPREPVFVWHEVQQTPEGRFRQIHRLLIPFPLMNDPDTPPTPSPPGTPGADEGGRGVPGPGEVHVWLESAGFDLTWEEHVSARMPVPEETDALGLADGMPLLQITRLTLDKNTTRPLILEELQFPAADQELVYTYGP